MKTYCAVWGRTGEVCADFKCLPCFAKRCYDISLKYDDPTLHAFMRAAVAEAERTHGDFAPDMWELIRILSEAKKQVRDSFAKYLQNCTMPSVLVVPK